MFRTSRFSYAQRSPLRLVISHILLSNIWEARLTECPEWSIVSKKRGVSQMIDRLALRLVIASVLLVQYRLAHYISARFPLILSTSFGNGLQYINFPYSLRPCGNVPRTVQPSWSLLDFPSISIPCLLRERVISHLSRRKRTPLFCKGLAIFLVLLLTRG